jgi:hypothetical protein
LHAHSWDALHPTKAFNRNGTCHESGCGADDVALLALVLYHQVTMLSDIGSPIRTDLLNETALPVRQRRHGNALFCDVVAQRQLRAVQTTALTAF